MTILSLLSTSPRKAATLTLATLLLVVSIASLTNNTFSAPPQHGSFSITQSAYGDREGIVASVYPNNLHRGVKEGAEDDNDDDEEGSRHFELGAEIANTAGLDEQLEKERSLIAPANEKQQMIQSQQGSVGDENGDSGDSTVHDEKSRSGNSSGGGSRGNEDNNNSIATSIGNIVLYGTIATITGLVSYTAYRLIKVKQRRSTILKNSGGGGGVNNGSTSASGSRG